MIPPVSRFTQSGDVSIAYQVLGQGPLNLIIVLGWVSHLEQAWEDPSCARFLERLASFSRLTLFDKHGTGLSDRITGIPPDKCMTRAMLERIASEAIPLLRTKSSE